MKTKYIDKNTLVGTCSIHATTFSPADKGIHIYASDVASKEGIITKQAVYEYASRGGSIDSYSPLFNNGNILEIKE